MADVPPPVPPVPHPEDLRNLRERMAAAACPSCSSYGSFSHAGEYTLSATPGALGTPVVGRACRSCGYLALYLA